VNADIRWRCERPATLATRLHVRWVGVDNAKCARAIVDRQSMPILAFVGTNGGGKTMAAVYTVLPTLAGLRWECANPDHLHTHGTDCAARRYLATEPTEVCDCSTTWTTVDGQGVVVELADGGTVEGWRRVLSTVALHDLEDTDRPSPYFERLRSFVQLLGVEHTDVLMDEVTGIASSRAHQSLPVQVENLIQQLRRRDARLLWTTPDFGNADNRIRSVTQGVVHCNGYSRVLSRLPGCVWWESRLLRWSLYDAAEFDLFTVGKRASLRPVSRQFLWGPGHLVRRAYDTFAAVSQLGVAAEGGMCLSCGGRRSAPSCTCPPDPDRLPPGVVETITATGSRRRRFDSGSVE